MNVCISFPCASECGLWRESKGVLSLFPFSLLSLGVSLRGERGQVRGREGRGRVRTGSQQHLVIWRWWSRCVGEALPPHAPLYAPTLRPHYLKLPHPLPPTCFPSLLLFFSLFLHLPSMFHSLIGTMSCTQFLTTNQDEMR